MPKDKLITNKEIAQLLRKVASAYEVKGENIFKVNAYLKAADAVEHATSELKDLWDDNRLSTLPGLGPAIRRHLDELFRHGKVEHFEQVMTGLPGGMFNFLDIPGVGVKTAFKLASTFGIKTVDELEKAAREDKIEKIPGFGKKSQEDILRSIAEFRRLSGRHLLPIAFDNASRVIDHLKQIPEVVKADPLGSLRRMVATVGDIDIAVASEQPNKVIDHFTKYKWVGQVLEAGQRKASVLLQNGVQIDLMVQPPRAYGALLQHFTGSKQHNIHLRELAIKRQMSLSEYGIKVNGKLLQFEEEKDFYKKLGLAWIPAELREDTGEIEAAQVDKLPELVELTGIKGEIHIHSSFEVETSHDLGANSFAELIIKASQLGYQYLGFSDHNPSVSEHTERQVIKIIQKRSKLIEQYKSSTKLNLLNLLEVDILVDGNLAISEEVCQLLDGVIAGIHSSMKQPKNQMTKRLLKAINNPNVSVISHPTGRLLKEREGYELDWQAVFAACLKNNKVLEINAWPARLDLPDVVVRDAVKNGVKMIINTDSHAAEHMDNMRFGVAVARRGWAQPKDIINTLPWVEFKKYFRL